MDADFKFCVQVKKNMMFQKLFFVLHLFASVLILFLLPVLSQSVHHLVLCLGNYFVGNFNIQKGS